MRIVNLEEVVDVHGEKINFPTLLYCWVCDGIKEVVVSPNSELKDKVKGDRDLAFQVALMEHGYMLAKWEGQNIMNKENFPKKCICECNHENVMETNIRMFEHHWECPDCGAKRTVDSSG